NTESSQTLYTDENSADILNRILPHEPDTINENVDSLPLGVDLEFTPEPDKQQEPNKQQNCDSDMRQEFVKMAEIINIFNNNLCEISQRVDKLSNDLINKSEFD